MCVALFLDVIAPKRSRRRRRRRRIEVKAGEGSSGERGGGGGGGGIRGGRFQKEGERAIIMLKKDSKRYKDTAD